MRQFLICILASVLICLGCQQPNSKVHEVDSKVVLALQAINEVPNKDQLKIIVEGYARGSGKLTEPTVRLVPGQFSRIVATYLQLIEQRGYDVEWNSQKIEFRLLPKGKKDYIARRNSLITYGADGDGVTRMIGDGEELR